MKSKSGRAGKPCALCGIRPSTEDGEHVLPSWLLDAYFHEDDGSYTIGPPGAQRGDPGTRTSQKFQAIKLACCNPCNNGKLNERFEMPGREPARALIEGHAQDLSPDDADHARLWVLKTWVLLTHPRTEFKNLRLPGVAWPGAPSSVYDWLINGQPPPDGLSAWAFWLEDPVETPPDMPRIDLPTVVADGITTRFRSLDLGVRNMSITLAFHPGWEIAHPGEADGSVIRLWPVPEQRTIPPLPRHRHRPVVYRSGPELWFEPGTYGNVDLPPLAPDTDPAWLAREFVTFTAAPRVGT